MTNFFEFLYKKQALDLLIVEDEKEAKKALEVGAFFDDFAFFALPDLRAFYLDDIRSFSHELLKLNEVLSFYYACNKPKILISPLATITKFLPNEKALKKIVLSQNDDLDLEDFKQELFYSGYSFVETVEQKGECSFRGDIIDIFAPSFENPVRISLFDTLIESLTSFDEQSQRNLKETLTTIEIIPANFTLNKASFDELSSLINACECDSFYKDISSLGFWFLNNAHLASNFLQDLKAFFLSDLSKAVDDIYSTPNGLVPKKDIKKTQVLPPATIFKPVIAKDINTLIDFHKDKKTTIIAKNEQSLGLVNSKVNFKQSTAIVNVISKDELILSLNKPEKPKRQKKPSLAVGDLKSGDFVVHEQYGVGVFNGLEQVNVFGMVRDFVAIIYQNEDKLLLPVENISLIDRFIAQKGFAPSLDRLGKGGFTKTKEKLKARLFEIAQKIIDTAALRELIVAKEISPPSMKVFQEKAGFEYTSDQKRAIDEILAEISSQKAMDRLLCGDVGFGKTEVAMNAIFATAACGFQCAIVVPTTLLCHQHFLQLQARFGDFGLNVAKYDRFTSTKEKTAIKDLLKSGELKILVGTHACLGLEFSNLALMIIDEEHKFGVKQKETLKNKSKDLHLLSMSATPIPRSLNLALSKIKTYSEILTPPSSRLDVRTFVKEASDALIKEAILRELRRAGQVFYIHNNISELKAKKEYLQNLLPTLRILVLHSQVTEEFSEKEMMNFINKKYDILLCTTIVESGIHIPNVNTIIIDDAHKFGMADLHQLRGRVGRSSLQGFCYLLVENKDEISEDSKKRLVSLEQNSFLGSGGVLAYHDLEIRGGGNILGAEQSGQIKQVGYSLYIKMLEDAISVLSATKQDVKQAKTEVKLSVRAFISSDLVASDSLRLELYRRLGACENLEEIYEIATEIQERFGSLDTPTKQFIEILAISFLGSNQKIKTISSYSVNIQIAYEDGSKKMLTAESKDDDSLISAVLEFLRKKKNI